MVIAAKSGCRLPFGQHLDDPCDSRPEHIREVTGNSLRYLGTDYIDVLCRHRVGPAVPVEEVAGAVGELVAAGKVKYFGLSQAGAETIRRARATYPVSVPGTGYPVFERAVEDAVLPAVREPGIGFVPYSPPGRGFLTGDFKPAADYPAGDMRSWDERWQPGSYERNAGAVRQLAELAGRKGIKVTQLALAWLLAQAGDIVPIPGTRRPDRLTENAAAADVVLTAEDLARIDEIVPAGAFGDRYPAEMMPGW
jgi:aryl-alcohol dehydrogenase-like predicted oxidoreductase